MTSARQRESNRINARRSTGPRTPAGKLRASRNAVRHGFTLPVSHDPAAAPQVAALARAIAALAAPARPPGTADALAEPARRVAEAQVDLVRIRRARHELFVEALAGPAHATPRLDLPTVRAVLTAHGRAGMGAARALHAARRRSTPAISARCSPASTGGSGRSTATSGAPAPAAAARSATSTAPAARRARRRPADEPAAVFYKTNPVAPAAARRAATASSFRGTPSGSRLRVRVA